MIFYESPRQRNRRCYCITVNPWNQKVAELELVDAFAVSTSGVRLDQGCISRARLGESAVRSKKKKSLKALQ
jgi:hypothetical protein